eukprot:scaffold79094_cov35-Cyclotella_meneghiniana.AAC.2
MVVTTDDDKHWYNHSVKLKNVPLHENQSLKRERHVKDNATGWANQNNIHFHMLFSIYLTMDGANS